MSTAIEIRNKGIVALAKKQFEASTDQMNFVKEAGFAIQILNNNPYLAGADPNSIKDAVVNVALCGLTLNPALKMAYLVPRRIGKTIKCVLDPSYMGLIKIITDAGAVKNIDSAVVYQNDVFEFEKGENPFIKHSPVLKDRGEAIGAYAVAYFRDGGIQFEVLSVDDLHKVRSTSESYKSEKGRQYSPWVTWTDEMWRKTAIKKLYKYLPKTDFSDKLIAALSTEYQNEQEDLAPERKYADIFDEEVQEAQVVPDSVMEQPITKDEAHTKKQPTQAEMNEMREDELTKEK